MKFPPPVPELPVADIRAAGISRDAARLFLRRRTPDEEKNPYSVLVWVNLDSAAEIDQLHAEWKERGVLIVKGLQTAPYNLREFTAEDGDGNRLRVFFDLGSAPTAT